MEKTPAELVEDLKSGLIKSITMGPRWQSTILIIGVMHSGIDAVIKGRRCPVTDNDAMKFIEYAKGAGMPVTIE